MSIAIETIANVITFSNSVSKRTFQANTFILKVSSPVDPETVWSLHVDCGQSVEFPDRSFVMTGTDAEVNNAHDALRELMHKLNVGMLSEISLWDSELVFGESMEINNTQFTYPMV